MSSLIGNNMLVGSASYVPPYTIDNSVRINDDDSAFLSKAYDSSGNRKTWTYSVWTKRGEIDQNNDGLLNCDVGATFGAIGFIGTSAQAITVIDHTFSGGSYQTQLQSNAMFVDPSAWYHVVVAYDTTQSTDTNRVKIWINGEQVTSFATETYPAEDFDGNINYGNGVKLTAIGKNPATADYYDGYVAEAHFLDGVVATPSDFAETNSKTNQWVPKEYTGSYGTNGFYLKFNSAALNTSFTDSSSNAFTITAGGDVHNSQTVKKVGASSINFDGTGDYLEVPDSSDWDFGSGSWTIEGWFYVTNWNTDSFIWNHYEDGNNYLGVRVISGGDLNVIARTTSGYTQNIDFTSVNLSTSTWTHLAIVRDTSAGNFVIYKDGVSVGTSADATAMANVTGTARINDDRKNSAYWTGYMDEFRVSDVARYTGTFTPSTTEFTSDSNTLLLIHSNWGGGLGEDSSGNGNTFTANNIVATDQMIDTPTNNFATLNPLVAPTSSEPTFSEGNLQTVDAAGWGGSSTIEQSSGKWYAEFYVKAHTSTVQHVVGVAYDPARTSEANEYPGRYDSGWGYYGNDGKSVTNGAFSTYGDTYDDGDIIGVALNLDDNELKFYKNNTVQNSGTALSITAAKSYAFAVGNAAGAPTTTWVANFGADSSFAGSVTAQGNKDGNDKGDFYYTPPSGFLALCTDNLSTPEIELPGEHFNTVLYSSDNTNNRAITGVGFQPDLLWIKRRNGTSSNTIYDVIRGASDAETSTLYTNSNSAEALTTDELDSFDSDGFTIDTGINGTGQTWVTHSWKAGGTGVSNTEGSLDATVSANTTAGFSIVRMDEDGTGGTATVGHGLSKAPELVIGKPFDAGDHWRVGSDYQASWATPMRLDTTAAEYSGPDCFDSTAPTATLVTMGSDGLNNTGYRSMLYCFHSVDGYSKIGSYEGNGNSDGPFIYTGFKPEFFLIKNIDAIEGWNMWDGTREPYNQLSKKISPNTNDAEYTANTTTYAIDFLSNGVKLWTNYSAVNASNTFLYYAVAKSPFKYSNAR